MSFLGPRESRFVERVFKRFYQENYRLLYIPERIQEREFGYFTFGEKIMVRHLDVAGEEELWRLVREATPLHLHYSAAFYRYPRAPMEEKEWMGAELIFDIDADHLDTGCEKEHDFKVCPSCRTPHPKDLEECPSCGGKLMEVEWVCELCLEAAKEESRKLLDFLQIDLGFKKITMAFSGNRGYHVVVKDEEVLTLGQRERKEIADYILAVGLEPKIMGLTARNIDPETAPDLNDPGWRGRIARAALQLASQPDAEQLHKLTGSPRAWRCAEEARDLAEAWDENPGWNALSPGCRLLLFKAAASLASSHIDSVVTTDIHRLLRLGNSLNGKTGMMAKVFDPGDLDEFDPFTEAVALPLDEEAEVHVINSPRFRLGDKTYGPYRDERLRLPLAATVLLLCKGAAFLPS